MEVNRDWAGVVILYGGKQGLGWSSNIVWR